MWAAANASITFFARLCLFGGIGMAALRGARMLCGLVRRSESGQLT
jgi:hypothetical protein